VHSNLLAAPWVTAVPVIGPCNLPSPE